MHFPASLELNASPSTEPAFWGSYRSDDLCATAACEPRPHRAFKIRCLLVQRVTRLASGLVCQKEQVDVVDSSLLLGHECLQLSNVELWGVGGIRSLRGSPFL